MAIVVPSKIESIEIQNFKFFPKVKPIIVQGKNLLLYGENGSGKSSIYWALYTLLEASNKANVKEIEKYFSPTNEERLLNINFDQTLPETPESFIKISFQDKSKDFKVSLKDTSINTNDEAQSSNFASDFINYRHLLNLYNFAHSEEINLFHFFKYAILPYVRFSPVNYWSEDKTGRIKELESDSASQILRFVEKGPQKKTPTKKIKEFSYPKRKDNDFEIYDNIVNGFFTNMKALIRDINEFGNEILNNDLKYNINFELVFDRKRFIKTSKRHLISDGDFITDIKYPFSDYPELSDDDFEKFQFKLSGQNFNAPEYFVWLKITNYEGQTDVVKRPHSFLNEAKLTAVALAIRLAVLKRTLSQEANSAKLKLLVLDDLLISLDMSNREKVIDLILNKYIKEYQVFLLTHDKVLFEDAKRHIDSFYTSMIKKVGISVAETESGMTIESKIVEETNANWLFYEMYQATSKSDFYYPFITEHKSSIQKAFYYFKEEVDYNASGNNLRTALEEFLRDFIPFNYFRDENNNPIPVKDKTLGLLLEKATKYFDYVGFNTDILLDLDRYIKRSLNPLSHYNPTSNYYRKELEDIFKIYFELNQLRNKPLLEKDSILKFDINTTDGNKYTYSVQLMDDIRAYNGNDGKPTFLLEKDKRRYGYLSVMINDKELKKRTGDSSVLTLKEFYDETIESIKEHLGKDPVIETDILNVYYNEYGVKLVDLLKLA
jgi:ABC-type dipeptide/oligopeptide/nickel transport system ATPase subunit